MTPTELHALRTARGLSQEAVAELVGAHRTSVLRWEAGLIEINPRTAIALRVALTKDSRTAKFAVKTVPRRSVTTTKR